MPSGAGAAASELAGPAPRPAPAERPAESQPGDNGGARQEPAVRLEWGGPGAARVGVPGDYTLAVRNVCSIPVHQVLVRVRIPAGLTVTATEPRALTEDNILIWQVGTLQPRQDGAMTMKLVAQARGDLMPQAWVTFTGSAVMRIQVREPRLALKVQAPEKVQAGDVAFTLTVSNAGDGSAEQVKVQARLPEGLEPARGNRTDFDLGNLAAGESRNVTLLCATRGGGPQRVEAVAEADGGLTARDSATVNVSTPRLDLQLTGPGLRYVGRKALFTLKVSNPGDAPAANVTVSDVVPEGYKVLAASHGGRHDPATRTVSWFLGEIGPGQAHEVQLEAQAVTAGAQRHKAAAVAARGLHADAGLATRVEGLSALQVEMVDTDDPIEVNSETTYEVRITNTGSKDETNIKLVATVPDLMAFQSARCSVPYHTEGKTVVFDPVAQLAPRAEAVFRIHARAVEAGTVRFKIQVTSTDLVEPVVKMEATRIYSDAPAPSGK
jgi:uncharacterized repeat protein (TIGR01451 family)